MRILGLLAISSLLLSSPIGAQDVENSLLGTWKGTFFTRGGAFERLIVIKSVQEQEGKRRVEGEIGPAGSMIPFQGTLELVKGEDVIKFMAGKYPTELTVKPGGKLEGWATNPENNYNFSAKFEKAK